MASGYFDFTSGATLTAAQLEDYCELQGIMRFASAAARTTALSGVLTEGLMCYLIDLNVIQVYSGSAWSTIGPVHGAQTSWTPVITQSGTPTFTNTLSWYTRVGRHVTGAFSLSLTGAGTSSNTITVTFPVTATTGTDAVGSGYFTDSSTGVTYPLILAASSTTVMLFIDSASSGVTANLLLGSGSSTFTGALASGDRLTGMFSYTAAADA